MTVNFIAEACTMPCSLNVSGAPIVIVNAPRGSPTLLNQTVST